MRSALVILDGWGLNPDESARDAVRAADTPTVDRLRAAGAFTTLETHGQRVGLPDGQMGNSEVGHLNIGAGRVVTQDSSRVSTEAEAGTLGETEAIAGAFDHVDATGGLVHFLGLVSEGGVHSYQHHLHALIAAAADRGVEAVTHAFTDGRDTPPKSGVDFLATLADVIDERGTGDVATVTGRYYAMDRDENWERTARAYDAIVNRVADHEAPDAVTAVAESYDRGTTDEFVEPTLIEGGPALADGDAVVFFNFRADRARQLIRMLADVRPDAWRAEGIETDPPDAHVVTMTEYDATFDLPVAFPPNQPEDTLGETLADAGLTQLRIAETEKYAHVTYFLNGGREVEFDGELRRIVESPDVATYDLRPEMSAAEVTDTAVSVVRADDPDVLVLNYANPDMVGHTGAFEATVVAVETVDEQLDRLADAVLDAGGHLLVTADHGNADDMGTPEDPHTAHTTNPVPFVYVAPGAGSPSDPESASGDAASGGTDGGLAVRDGGTLADVAPTLLSLVGVDQPAAMTGESLLCEE